MSIVDPNTPAVTTAQATTTSNAPASVPALQEQKPSNVDPTWLNDRLAQAKNSGKSDVLKELGVENVDVLKAAIAAAKAKEDADKTAETKAAELRLKLDSESARAAEQHKIISEYAGRQMIGLTPEQKAAVIAVAGDDPGKQLNAIGALQPTWATEAAKTANAAPAAKAAPPDTAPGHTAPTGGGAASPPNNRALYDEARKANPFAAAEHGLRHEAEVYKTPA